MSKLRPSDMGNHSVAELVDGLGFEWRDNVTKITGFLIAVEFFVDAFPTATLLRQGVDNEGRPWDRLHVPAWRLDRKSYP